MYQINKIYKANDLEFRTRFSATILNFIQDKYLKCLMVEEAEVGKKVTFQVLGTRKKLVTFSKLRESKHTYLLSHKGKAKEGIEACREEYLLPGEICQIFGEDRKIYDAFNEYRTLKISEAVVERYIKNENELKEYLKTILGEFSYMINLTPESARVLAKYFLKNEEM